MNVYKVRSYYVDIIVAVNTVEEILPTIIPTLKERDYMFKGESDEVIKMRSKGLPTHKIEHLYSDVKSPTVLDVTDTDF